MTRGHVLVIAVCLLVAASGAVGLVARSKSPTPPPRWQLFTALFRVIVGLAMIVVLLATR